MDDTPSLESALKLYDEAHIMLLRAIERTLDLNMSVVFSEDIVLDREIARIIVDAAVSLLHVATGVVLEARKPY